jgi:hypothetical protein
MFNHRKPCDTARVALLLPRYQILVNKEERTRLLWVTGVAF